MFLKDSDLPHSLNPQYIARGLRYFKEGRVTSVEWYADRRTIAAQVRGSGSHQYRLMIRLDRNPSGRLEITGQCSCPIHYNCKHVAAVMFDLIRRQQTGENSGDRLPRDLSVWFERLQEAERQAQREEPADRLLYLLDTDINFAGRFLTVQVVKTRLLKSGKYKAASPYRINAASTARFLRPEDRRIMALLEAGKRSVSYSVELRGAAGGLCLESMLATQRCHWQTQDTPALQAAPPIASAFDWSMSEDGRQNIHASAAEFDSIVLPLSPPWLLDTQNARCAPLDTGLAPALAEALAAAPPVDIEQAKQLAASMQKSFPKRSLPAPITPKLKRRKDIKPRYCLRLFSEEEETGPYAYEEPLWEHYAEFFFDYNGQAVHPWDEQDSLTHASEQGVEQIERQGKDEQAAMNYLLNDLGFIPDERLSADDSLLMYLPEGEEGWLQFVLQDLPILKQNGWRIETDPSFRLNVIEPDDWYAQVEEGSGEDWFGLELGVDLDGEKINLLPILADYLSSLKDAQDLQDLRKLPDEIPLICPLGDGRSLKLPISRVRHIIDVLTELYDPHALNEEGQLQLSRLHAAQLQDLTQDGTELTWQGGEALRKYGERLRSFEGIQKVAAPKSLHAQLRPYQQEGLSWLQFLREFELGGILADDMGLGKTIQTLAHLLIEKQEGRADRPSLVVAPTSLMFNWRREAEQFAPELKVLTLQGNERKQHFDAIVEHDLILTTYPLLPRDADVLLAQPYHLLILDEAQHIKNPRAKAAETARRIDARHRLCLTGTPLENHLGELWSQFHFLMPGLLGDEKRFRRLFRTPIEKHADEARGESLRRRIGPFMLRRDKSAVLTELPPKTEILSEVELGGAQRDLYETIRIAMHEKVRKEIDKKGLRRSQIVILDALLKLRQVCCDPRLLKMDAAQKVKQSAKLDMLGEMLPEMVAEGRKVLLFSQFTSMLQLIEDMLNKAKIDYVKLTGRTRDRATPIDRFQRGDVPVFLISLKAGGSGLNLTAADTVIHYDPWWNPAVERQATDRAHRIGQDKSVFVYKFITKGTVEEKISAMQARKQELADALFGGSAGKAALSADDLKELFEPLE